MQLDAPNSKPPAISKAKLQDIAENRVPYVGQTGVVVDSLAYGQVSLRIPYNENFLRPGGTIAGPVMMGLADLAMYGVVLSMIGPVELAVTTSLNINFLRKPKPGDIIAKGRILKLGKRLAVGEVNIYRQGDSDPVAHVTSTYSIPPGIDKQV